MKEKICKHWKTCEEYFCIRHKPHRCGNIGDGHICNPADWKRDKCNSKCILYIPEQEYECTRSEPCWRLAKNLCAELIQLSDKPCHYWQPKKPTEQLAKEVSARRAEPLRILAEELGTATCKFDGLETTISIEPTCPECGWVCPSCGYKNEA